METGSRRQRELRTIAAMIGIFCRGHHRGRSGPCEECARLKDYAERRLEKCLFQDDKPVCADCPVHCYQPEMRTRVKEVMRYAGPRMTYRHPILALLHFLEGRKHRTLPPVRTRVASAACCAAAPDAPPRSTGATPGEPSPPP